MQATRTGPGDGRRRSGARGPRGRRPRGPHGHDLLDRRGWSSGDSDSTPGSSSRSPAIGSSASSQSRRGTFPLDDLRARRRPSSPRPFARFSPSPRSTAAKRPRPGRSNARGDRRLRSRAEARARTLVLDPADRVDLQLTDEQRLISETAREFATGRSPHGYVAERPGGALRPRAGLQARGDGLPGGPRSPRSTADAGSTTSATG